MANQDITIAVPVKSARKSAPLSLCEELVYVALLGAGEGALLALAILTALGH
jgi:hypothetical protein